MEAEGKEIKKLEKGKEQDGVGEEMCRTKRRKRHKERSSGGRRKRDKESGGGERRGGK